MGRFKDFILKDKKFLLEVVIILIVGIIVNGLCFLLPLVVHAETVQYFPFESGYNENNINVNQSFIDEQMTNGAVFIRCYSDASSSYPNRMRYAVLTDIEQNAPTQVRLYGEILSGYGGSSFSLYWDNPNALISYKVNYYLDWGDGSDITQTSYDSNTLRPFNNISSAVDSNNVYYTKYNINLNSANNTENVLIYASAEEIQVGEFVDLPNLDEILDDLSNSYEAPSSLTGHALPSQPTENPNNNDFQNRLQMFDYLKDTLTALFGNLGYNISNWLNSLGSKIVQGFNSVSQNIWNGFKTLMDNIKDFFAPKLDYIIDKFNYITAEPDSEQIIDFIETTSIYSDISSINTSVNTFGSSFTSVSEPDDYTITFHIEDIDILNQSDPFVLHLNILNPIKSTLRAFLWVIVSYGLFISVIDSLPNYINGGGGEDD